MIIEVATFRKDVSEDNFDPDLVKDDAGKIIRDNVWGSLQDDCKRRDFSINAIYYCPLTQKIFDEHNGIKDIANKRIEPSEMTALFENLEYEDSFLITEGFRSDYDYHLINISLSSNSTNNTIKKIIQYFNSNPLFISLKEMNSNRISQIILDNEKSINQIDQILAQYMTSQSTNSSQLYIDNKEINANDLIKTKIGLQQKNEELKYENLTTTDTVIAVNESNVLFENYFF